MIVSAIVNKIKINRKAKHWRKLNAHNNTGAISISNFDLVKVGKYTYGGIDVMMFNNENTLTIGNFCSIGPNVKFILSADHEIAHISTFPYKTYCVNDKCLEGISKGNIIVDDDVWIGYGATIMSGVHIGQGAVIAAGAVVTKDVPPYAIVGGVPAKVIKYRFEPELIQELMKVDYSKLTKEMIESHIDELYEDLKDTKQLEWMPKKG